MAFEDTNSMEEFETQESGSPPPEESGNRTFVIVAGILAAIMVLTLLCTAGYALIMVPRQRSARETQAAAIIATNTAIAMQAELSVKMTEQAKITPTRVPPTATQPLPTPTNTQVVAKPATATGTPGVDPRTATVAALLTQAAIAQKTVVPTSTLLPKGGFADEVGLPGLLVMGVALVVVIFLARRLRTAS